MILLFTNTNEENMGIPYDHKKFNYLRMKRIVFFALLFFIMIKLSGQTQGISYQAVIIDNSPQEIPGVDISGNILPNHPILVRFTILDTAGTINYQEEQATTTDAYGMINLTIGKGTPTTSSPTTFRGIDWDGTLKSLKVDISLSQTDIFYTDFSFQELSFVPYAYHKNITATGTLAVNGATTLKSRLDVTNGSSTFLSGNLQVDKSTTLQKDLTVDSVSNLNGQVTINANVSGDKSSDSSYSLRVEGSNQGIGVKIKGSRSSSNNFVTFWDDGGVQGSIQGQTVDELLSDPDYIFQNVVFANTILNATASEVQAIAGLAAASTSSTVCVGVGACVTSPVPSLIVAAVAGVVVQSANLAVAIAQPIEYNVLQVQNIGVTYSSGSGDYAEWLPKSNINEEFLSGDIVGVKGGYITKSSLNTDKFMVISRNPIVLGNMPAKGKEASFEKVAFLGQVPVKVLGKVNTGDYILPSGKDDGSGAAVSPENIQPEQYQKIVGIAWSNSDSLNYNYVNVAVGINTNDIAKLSIKQQKKIDDQQAEIDTLKEQINHMNLVLAQLVPNYSTFLGNTKKAATKSTDTITVQSERTVVYYNVTRDQILEGIDMAAQKLKEKGVDLDKHPFFSKINSDADYKEKYISKLQSSMQKELDAMYQKDLKTGAKIIKY